jgi:hypothetical protein
MKHLLILAQLATLPAIADDFATRVADAKRESSSVVGGKYDHSLGPSIGATIEHCVPAGSTDPANLGKFVLVAEVPTDGMPTNVVVAPKTTVSACFAKHFAAVKLPIPPLEKPKERYPIVVEITVAP